MASISVYVSAEFKEQIDKAKHEHGLNVSEICKKALERALRAPTQQELEELAEYYDTHDSVTGELLIEHVPEVSIKYLNDVSSAVSHVQQMYSEGWRTISITPSGAQYCVAMQR